MHTEYMMKHTYRDNKNKPDDTGEREKHEGSKYFAYSIIRMNFTIDVHAPFWYLLRVVVAIIIHTPSLYIEHTF